MAPTFTSISPNFGSNEVCYHLSLALAIGGDRLTKRLNNATGSKPKPNTNFSNTIPTGLSYEGWCYPSYGNSVYLHGHYTTMRLVTKDDCSVNILVIFQTLQNPVSESTALPMIVYLEVMDPINYLRV